MSRELNYEPRRMLAKSVMLMRIWACVSLLLGAVATLPLTIALLNGRTKLSFPGHALYFGACVIVFIAPAVLYLVLAIYLQQRRHWALVAAIVTAGFHDLCATIGLVGLLLFALPKVGRYILVPASGAALFVVACTHLIVSLARSFDALRMPMDDEPRGFEPMSPAR